MSNKSILFIIFLFIFPSLTEGQTAQGFFLDGWKSLSIGNPDYIDVPQTTDPVTASVTINFNDTLTKIPPYIFGDNANVYTGTMSDNPTLMKNIKNRKLGVLRGPSGSISDVFFWNRSVDNPPKDIPAKLAGQTDNFSPWYGVRPYSWENWTMSVDSFYRILDQVGATGMITVNYGYARYGTSANPVAQAAHLAADWVRYDKGHTKFWEIGNEVFGSWEAGYRIDQSLNHDGQPEYITGTLYGQHARVFIDSMRVAAAQTHVNIKIGLVMLDDYSSADATLNRDIAAAAGDVADFYVVHNYFTPYNQNSSIDIILNSPRRTSIFKNYVWTEVEKAGRPMLPVALTEYNIFATGSMQAVSHINGMHAVMVTCEAIKYGYGVACRWDLANGWSSGDDHGMFSYGSEPGVATYAPRPAFYHLYFLRKFTGDIALRPSMRGDTNVVVYASAFHSGQLAAQLVNKGKIKQVVRINIQNFKCGNRYYTYTLAGGTDNGNFSRKVYVNGIGPAGVAGGPSDYEAIKSNSSVIENEIKVELPPYSIAHILIEPGDKTLEVNNDIFGIDQESVSSATTISPNPANTQFSILQIPPGFSKVEVFTLSGKRIFADTFTGDAYSWEENKKLIPDGIYFVKVSGGKTFFTKKLILLH